MAESFFLQGCCWNREHICGWNRWTGSHRELFNRKMLHLHHFVEDTLVEITLHLLTYFMVSSKRCDLLVPCRLSSTQFLLNYYYCVAMRIPCTAIGRLFCEDHFFVQSPFLRIGVDYLHYFMVHMLHASIVSRNISGDLTSVGATRRLMYFSTNLL